MGCLLIFVVVLNIDMVLGYDEVVGCVKLVGCSHAKFFVLSQFSNASK